ncbi:glycosyltransferase [Providencia stuartii]|uniref:glycosyltransferase n=1 Tax=Providencia stuartii TaxID=588 RepID=UPI003324508C
MKKIKVAIFQPIIPHYRVSFFLNLLDNSTIDFHIYASEKDINGLSSESSIFEKKQFNKLGNIIKIPKVNAYWQRGIKLFSILKFDAVVISGNPRYINQMILFLFCKLFRIKIIWWGQGWTANKRGFLAKLRRKLMLNSNGIILYTEKEAHEINNKKFVIGLNNGIDIIPIDKALSKININYSFSYNTLRLVFIGRLTAKSEILKIFEALKYVKRKVKLSIIGEGELSEHLKKFYVDNLKANTNISIHFYGELYQPDEIANILIYNDAFIYPGSVGLSLIHAFAHGLPAIIHNDEKAHMPEFSAFKHNYNGLEMPADVHKLANFLEQVSTEKLYSMRLNAKKTVANDYNTQAMAIKFRTLITDIFNL